MKLVIYQNRSVLINENGTEEFFEGGQSREAKERTKFIKEQLKEGYLEKIIKGEMTTPTVMDKLTEADQAMIRNLVSSVTSETGRALIGVTIMQFCIKAIQPEQSIRLHKGGTGGGSNFSWNEGISMRTLDKPYITPVLRKYKLLSLNADGFMMTRSLAENYPYTKLYKAAIRGAKDSWLDIVERLEKGLLEPAEGLSYIISLLVNRTVVFKTLVDECIRSIQCIASASTPTQIFKFIEKYISDSHYSARLFEVAIHSIFQVLADNDDLEGELKPLSQMRSANKKHGNIGDVEVLLREKSPVILESWDTKFGKSDLTEELEELSEKLRDHPACMIAGFVTNSHCNIDDTLRARIEDIQQLHDVEIQLLSFREFIIKIVQPRISSETFEHDWLTAFAESICQRRREYAPIDEPCQEWVRELRDAAQ